MPVEKVKVAPGKRITLKDIPQATIINMGNLPMSIQGNYQLCGIGRMQPIPTPNSTNKELKESPEDIRSTAQRNNVVIKRK